MADSDGLKWNSMRPLVQGFELSGNMDHGLKPNRHGREESHMTELEKIEYAKMFIDQLANGINPLDGTPIPETDIVTHVRLSRCFSYVSDILRQVIENGGTTCRKTPKIRKKAFSLSSEDREKLTVSDKPLTVSEIATYLNTFVDSEIKVELLLI